MSAVSFTSEVLRSRILILQSPPRGTPSRVFKTRLDRSSRRPFAHQVSDSALSSSASPTSAPFQPLGRISRNGFRSPIPQSSYDRGRGRMGAPSTQIETGLQEEAPNVREEVLLLRKMLLATTPPTLQHQTSAPIPTAVNKTSQEHASELRISDWRTESLFQRLRAGDTRAIFRWMVPTANWKPAASAEVGGSSNSAATLAEEEQQRYQIAAHLPPLVFSELLRCLDPFAVSEHRDHVQDIVISAGMAQFTPLRGQVNRYGIRVLYTTLLRALLSVYALRVEADRGLLLNDYVVLMRCAGAASDMDTARRIWNDMEQAGYITWRQSEVYGEFVRARFLTEALYTQQDPVRLRVRPVNLHRQKLMLHPTRLHRLERLRRALERYKAQRFGQNPNEPDYVEHLTRILRKTKPVRGVFSKASILGYAHDERLLAAVMIAFGRTGSVGALDAILANYWKVRVVRDRTTRKVVVGGGAHFPPGSPMRPSAVLLDAVVQAYCCHGEVACALQVLDYVSRRYNVAIPDKVWFDLLNWTYVMTTKPASTEWKWAGFPERVLKPGATEMIWAAMTSAPYHVQPGFAQYHVLVKTLISQRRYDGALALMRQAKPIYQAQLREHEDALLEYAETARQRAPELLGAASRRVARAANKKWYMWYCFQTWCWHILKKLQPRGLDDPLVVRTIPRMIDEFRPFVPRVARYRIKTGTVRLREPHRQHAKHVGERQTVDLPALRPHIMFQHRTIDMGDATPDAAATEQAQENEGEDGSDDKVISAEEQWRRGRRLTRGVLRRRTMWLRKPVHSTPDMRALGPATPRDWLVREFA